MSDEVLADDQSHYEISLTAGQAFIAFVLLLLSLAASFGFGLMIGRGQGDDRLVVRKEPAVVNEASVIPKKSAGHIVELGVADEDFAKQQAAKSETSGAVAPVVTEDPAAATSTAADASSPSPAPSTSPAKAAEPAQSPTEPAAAHRSVIDSAATPAPHEAAKAVAPDPGGASSAQAKSGPAYAQLILTTDQKTAEALAANVINGGFNSAYVEHTTSTKGPAFRVRVKFASEAEARAALPKLKTFANDVWIAR